MTTSLATFALTSPAMLGGLALLALPALAHLLHRRVRRKIVFPTVALLAESAAAQSSWFRWRHWILLTLRCLAVALLVLVFARPMWLDGSAAIKPPGGEGGAAVVLVVDASASMQQQVQGMALAHSVRAAAGRVLDSLTPGIDVADVVYADGHPTLSVGILSPNLAALRQEVDQFVPTNERADLRRAIAMVGQRLADHAGPRRLVILSDMQKTNWVEVHGPEGIRGLVPADTVTTVMPLRQGQAANVALSKPRTLPALPVVGQEVQLVTTVSCFSGSSQIVRVNLEVDERQVGSQSLTVGPWEQRDVSFARTWDQVGEHRAVFSIAGDALPVDDRAYLVARVAQRPVVTVLADDDPNVAGSSAYFLTRGLAPRGDATDHFDVHHLTSAAISDAKLSDAAVVVVGHVNALSSAGTQSLARFVQRGGGLLLFCGEGPVRQNLMSLDTAWGREGMLPWLPGEARNLGAAGDSLRLDEDQWKQALLREFDEASRAAAGQVRFTRSWGVEKLKPEAQILLRFSDSTPALVSRRPVGEPDSAPGMVVVANFSPAASCCDLGKSGLFVALTQALVGQIAAPHDSGSTALVGQPLHAAIPLRGGAVERVVVQGPDDQPAETDQLPGSDHVTITVPRPARPGYYTLSSGGHAIRTLVVNVDPRESDLRPMDDRALQQALKLGAAAAEIGNVDAPGPLLHIHGRQLWPWMLAAALGVFAAEMVLLIVWQR